MDKTAQILVQLLGFIAMGESFLIYIQKSHKRVLMAKLIDDVLWTVHYFLLGAVSGGVLNLIAIGRETVFYNNDKKWAKSPIWILAFIVVSWVSVISTWQGPISALPATGTTFAIVGFSSNSAFVSRLLGIPAQMLWCIYTFCMHSWGGFAGSIIVLTSAVVGLIKFDILGKNIHLKPQKGENDDNNGNNNDNEPSPRQK